MKDNIVKYIQVMNKDCIGCKSTGKDIMVGIQMEDMDIIDFFMTNDEAEVFAEKLLNRVHKNKKDNK